MSSDTHDVAAIKRVLDQYAAHGSAGDLDGWLELWAEDGVQMPNDAPSRVGKDQIREAMKPVFDAMHASISIRSVDEARVWGERGMTRCTYSLRLTPKEGGDTIDAMPDGKALTLYEKQPDGTWKIVYDCFNSSAPPGQGSS